MKTWTLYKSSLLGHVRYAPIWIELLWEPRNLWVGVFVKNPHQLYVMLLPCIGFRILAAARVGCTNPNCRNPATIKCVRAAYGGAAPAWGTDYARGAMCDQHGQAGVPCSTDPEKSFHTSIPDGQQWRWVGRNDVEQVRSY